MDDDSRGRVAWNVGAGVAGVLLAGLAILGLVQSQGSVKQEQTYQKTISYDG